MPELTVEFGSEDLEEQVVREAARKLLTWTSYGPDSERADVQTDLAKRLTSHIDDALKELARKHAEPIVRDVLAGELPIRDRFGYAVSNEKKTLAEMIGDEVKEALNRGNHRSSGRSLLQGILREEVEYQLGGELRTAVDEAKSAALEAIKSETVKAIDAALKRAAGRL